MAEKTSVACESCKTQTNVPASIVVKFNGGREFRTLVCRDCAELAIKFINIPRTT